LKVHCDACESKDFELTEKDLMARNIEIDGEPAKLFYFDCPFCEKEYPYLYLVPKVKILLEEVKKQEKEVRTLIEKAKRTKKKKDANKAEKEYKRLAHKRRVLKEAHDKVKLKVKEVPENDSN